MFCSRFQLVPGPGQLNAMCEPLTIGRAADRSWPAMAVSDSCSMELQTKKARCDLVWELGRAPKHQAPVTHTRSAPLSTVGQREKFKQMYRYRSLMPTSTASADGRLSSTCCSPLSRAHVPSRSAAASSSTCTRSCRRSSLLCLVLKARYIAIYRHPMGEFTQTLEVKEQKGDERG